MSEMWNVSFDLEHGPDAIDRLRWLAQSAMALSMRALRFLRSYLPCALVAAAVMASSALAQPAPDVPFVPSGAIHPMKLERLHDADTIWASMDLEIAGLSISPKGGWRAANYDACEVNRDRERVVGPISDNEIAIGKKATTDLAALIAQGKLYGKPSDLSDPHGRGSAELYIKLPNGWLDVAAWMKAHGYLRSQLPPVVAK